MAKEKIDNLESLNLEEILNIRLELEQYINVIDEHVITSKTDLKGIITYASSAFCQISGYTEDELVGQSHNLIRHPDMPRELFKELWEVISQEKTWSGEIKNLKKDGSYYWVNTKITPTYDFDGKHIGYTSVRQDVSDKKKIEEISLTDELTGLYNRRYFNQVIEKEINRAKRNKKVFSFLILDIDDFKKYNDNYGHQKGDICLQKIGSFMNNYFKRASDIAFRLGGEEFCIIYTTKTVEQAIELADKLVKDIENLQIQHEFNQSSKFITVSIGSTMCDFSSNTTLTTKCDELYKKADETLYNAKQLGKNQHQTTLTSNA